MTADVDKLANAVISLSAILEEVINQLALLRFAINAENQDKTKQCIYNRECTNCGKCVSEGVEVPEVVS
jgi:hypothetical protein